jgi:hypothetical protein
MTSRARWTPRRDTRMALAACACDVDPPFGVSIVNLFEPCGKFAIFAATIWRWLMSRLRRLFVLATATPP